MIFLGLKLMANFKLIASYLISLIIIGAILYTIDLSNVLAQIMSFGIIETLIGFVLVFLSYVFRAILWKQLLSPFTDVGLKKTYHITIIGFFINNFLPLRAGEIARAFLLHKSHAIGKLKIFSTIIVERLIEGLSLVFIFVIAMLFIPQISEELFVLMILSAILFFGLFLAFIFSSYTEKILEKIFGFSESLKEKIIFLFKELFIGEAALKKGIKENIVIWGSSLILWGIYFILYFFVALTLGIQIGFFELVIVLAVSSLSTIIPSAPGYIGTFEAGFVLAFAALGLSVETAISMAIIIHLLFFIGTTILGFVSLKGLNISLTDLTKIGSKTK